MQNPEKFYTSQKQLHEQELASLKKKLTIYSTVRLLVFFTTIGLVYLNFKQKNIAITIAFLGVLLFAYLIVQYSKLQQRKNLVKALVKINKIELRVQKRDYFDLETGSEFIDPSHFYSYDIDLFGKGSFFQYCNRTATNHGRKKFAEALLENNISTIENKQKSIKELAEMPKWRQNFSAIASLTKVEYSTKLIVNWIHNYQPTFPKLASVLPVVFSAISVLLITLISFDIVSSPLLVIWFFIGLALSGLYLKRVNVLYEQATKAKETFRQYHTLLNQIETTTFTSTILKTRQQEISEETQKASQIFNKFSKLLDALDQRNNILIAIVANGLLLRDLKIAYKIEKWIDSYHHQVEKWFDVVAFFDAQNTLANIAFNHPNYVFPKINTDNQIIKSKNLGHVLLKETQRINNHFSIEKEQFFIITGANMAGKSTFLRTVSLSIVMANMGLPVCAESFEYTPTKLITSMRTTDSLAEDESYFFSELKRLKFIVDQINPTKRDPKYFIILDEILKGTNSTDKAIGSKKFVEKLVSSGSTGIIATHDLSLCEIEKSIDQIKNYYFDAEIINDELHFDYKLKDGICKNMNASFLLKKMEIV